MQQVHKKNLEIWNRQHKYIEQKLNIDFLPFIGKAPIGQKTSKFLNL